MMKRNIKRRGFTLVELLIVIVVIGILSAMMMLSSTEAVTSAKASNIVSNLRNLKTAALAMYIDNMDKFDKNDYKIATTSTTESGGKKDCSITDVVKYMNGGENFGDSTGYSIEQTAAGDWYLKYEIQGTGTEKTQIKQKLKGRAKSVGLLKQATNTTTDTNDPSKTVTTTTYPEYDGDDEVYYFVR